MKKIYKEGGLATDGLETDPVSGNDIPPGSNAEDVRDDVDAQLSSGEYVVPADVVKFFGVSYFEKLRAKAKAGLEEMEDDGRMGGEPVSEPSFEEDMIAADGYASGGVVDSGSDVDGIIERVKAAAMKDPSVSNLLKSKGIFIQQPVQGQSAQAPAVQGQAAPRQFAEGGSVLTGQYSPQNNESDFNPYTYTPGFSAESGVTGNAPTIPGTPVGGAAPTQDPAATQQPVTCPPGYVLDPVTNSCVPEQATGGSGDRTKVEHDPEAWMTKYDYSDPDTLFNASMNTLGLGETDEEQGLLGKLGGMVSGFFDNGILGKIFKTQKYAEVMANANVLESHGYKDQANSLRESAGGYAKEHGVKVGGFFDSTKTLTNMAMKNYGQNNMLSGRMSGATSTPKGDERPSTTKSGGRITYSDQPYKDKGLELARKVKSSSPKTQAALVKKRERGDARPATWKGGKVAANQSSPNKSSSSSYGNSDAGGSKTKSVEERKGSGPMHSGGRDTGGLVDKNTKLKKKGLASKPAKK
tara:strand:+ start:5712 stop:7283 length:1572 start_codon:yes stop_codon:yes gene_type:complete